MAIIFDDGRAETKLTIREAAPKTDPKNNESSSANTGDENNIMDWIIRLAISSAASVFLLIAALRNRRMS